MPPSRLDTLLTMLHKEPKDSFLLYSVAQEYAKAGDAPNACTYFDRCIASDSLYCYAYYHKGRVQADAGDIDAAIKTLNTGIIASERAGDGKALGELTSLLDSLT